MDGFPISLNSCEPHRNTSNCGGSHSPRSKGINWKKKALKPRAGSPIFHTCPHLDLMTFFTYSFPTRNRLESTSVLSPSHSPFPSSFQKKKKKSTQSPSQAASAPEVLTAELSASPGQPVTNHQKTWTRKAKATEPSLLSVPKEHSFQSAQWIGSRSWKSILLLDSTSQVIKRKSKRLTEYGERKTTPISKHAYFNSIF